MKYKTNTNRGLIVDLILSNEIETTPVQTDSDSMYAIGKNKIFITIQYNKKHEAISSYCINNSGCGEKYLVFRDPKDANFIDKACKQRIKSQYHEKKKIEERTRQEKKLIKEQRKIERFRARFGIDFQQNKR